MNNILILSNVIGTCSRLRWSPPAPPYFGPSSSKHMSAFCRRLHDIVPGSKLLETLSYVCPPGVHMPLSLEVVVKHETPGLRWASKLALWRSD